MRRLKEMLSNKALKDMNPRDQMTYGFGIGAAITRDAIDWCIEKIKKGVKCLKGLTYSRKE